MSGKTIDLFVSYATRDARELAEDIVADLEARGVTCWIAPRDIPAGARSWAAEIVASIRNCRSFLLLLSSGANASEEIEKEIDEAARQRKTLFAIRVEDIEPNPGLGYHLNRVQWRDLFRNRELVLEEIAARVVALRDVGRPEASSSEAVQGSVASRPAQVKKGRGVPLGLFVLGVIAIVVAGGAWILTRPAPADLRASSGSTQATPVAPVQATGPTPGANVPSPVAEVAPRRQPDASPSAVNPIAAPVPPPASAPRTNAPSPAADVAPQRQPDPPPAAVNPVSPSTPAAPATVAPVATSSAPSPGRAISFDGRWEVTIICKDTGNGVAGYTQRFPAEVKENRFDGQYNAPGTSPSATMRGQIAADGAALLEVTGLTGPPAYSVGQVRSGSPFKYTVRARFSRDSGSGERVELRPCAVEFARRP